MLFYGESETTARFSECFGLLINGDFFAMKLILRTFFSFLGATGMRKRQGLAVFAGGLPKDSISAPMDFCLWELCFSLVSPLWELCYSLASC